MKEHPFHITMESNFREIARALTVIENDLTGSAAILKSLSIPERANVVGITGPPGAGKSTLVNALIGELLARQKKIAVLAIDPTSPFSKGSLLGDRIRMAGHFNHPDVFIRSLATRGSLGGLSAKAIEMTDVLRAAGFDYIIIETVGVGQSEVEIAGLADVTLLVLVPESGDEIQIIKSGLMEIADAFIINKADRPGAAHFANTLKKLTQTGNDRAAVPVYQTIASEKKGITDIADFISKASISNHKKILLLTEKAYKIIQERRMADIDKNKLSTAVSEATSDPGFNLYAFVETYF